MIKGHITGIRESSSVRINSTVPVIASVELTVDISADNLAHIDISRPVTITQEVDQ